jgi:regulator of RNase E activity RraA
MDDPQLFGVIRERLFTAVIGDVMDRAGLRRQFLPPEIRSIALDTVLVGRAMPVVVADSIGGESAPGGDVFGLMFRALDDLQTGEVYVSAGGSPAYALWGGLMSTRAALLGSGGAVLDGYHRDTREILRLGFPLFSRGAYAQDQRDRGRVVDFRCPVVFANGSCVEPGDVIVGDVDGVLVIPRDSVGDVVEAALAKASGEEDVRRMIEGGQATQDIFAKTGIM